ncbi:MAG: hypothetical protein F6K47_37385 [Symploca sp. SIO2E6]|nr:hypothetical protein [Symploca sp. SIO2E6]
MKFFHGDCLGASWLKGTLDYYFPDLLVIEAKRDNLDHGFTQLAVELIALDQWINSESPILYGAVTTYGYSH